MAEHAPIRPTRVEFHFDVMCPFAYQTSKWIRDVRRQTDLQIDWRFFSLEEINRVDGKKHPWEREWSYGWSMMRIGALLRRSSMDDLDRWYQRAGRALHEEGHRPHDPDVARPTYPDGEVPNRWRGAGYRRAYTTKCTQCHTKVHGSDSPSQTVPALGRGLTR